MTRADLDLLERRLGRKRLDERIAVERAREAAGGSGIDPIRIAGISISDHTIRTVLKLTRLYRRGCRNAADIRVRHNRVRTPLPGAFDGFTILQLSDLHVDMNQEGMRRLALILEEIEYDLCVLTGDYRGRNRGPFDAVVAGMAALRDRIKGAVYGVLGDHDTIHMVPALEALGIRILLNECESITRDGQCIYLAGVDDAQWHHMDDVNAAAAPIPPGAFSILLSHTPEVYDKAARARFRLMLSGHTHGGQICLPGKIPMTLEADLPRRMGAGAWRYKCLMGYTSVGAGCSIVPVRFNCPPEITLHHLEAATTHGNPEIENPKSGLEWVADRLF